MPAPPCPVHLLPMTATSTLFASAAPSVYSTYANAYDQPPLMQRPGHIQFPVLVSGISVNTTLYVLHCLESFSAYWQYFQSSNICPDLRCCRGLLHSVFKVSSHAVCHTVDTIESRTTFYRYQASSPAGPGIGKHSSHFKQPRSNADRPRKRFQTYLAYSIRASTVRDDFSVLHQGLGIANTVNLMCSFSLEKIPRTR